MRKMLLTLVGVVAIGCGGVQTAMAHGYGYGHRGPVPYRANYGGYGRGVCGPNVGYGARYGAGYRGVYPYGAAYAAPGYGYAYPQAGFGVAGRNFSLWFNQ